MNSSKNSEMKKVFIAIVVLVMATLISALVNFVETKPSSMTLLNVEAISSDENPFCYNGGEGSSGCSISGGITILSYGVSAQCSVTCNSGYYACCGVRCTCKKEKK